MAKEIGHAPSAAHRIWRALGLQPQVSRHQTLLRPVGDGAGHRRPYLSPSQRAKGDLSRVSSSAESRGSLSRVESDPSTTLPTGSNGRIDECDARDAIIYSRK